MKLDFSIEAFSDLQEWIMTEKKKASKIMDLIADIQNHPFEGIGKPEPLKYEWSGYWSRRIDGEHRLVYRIKGDTIEIASCKYHYS